MSTMEVFDQRARPAAPPAREQVAALSDREMLDALTDAQVSENRSHAERLELLHTFHTRRVAERKQGRTSSDPFFFQLTPLRETQAEVAPLLGVGDQTIAIWLDTAADLMCWLPRLWQRCLTGRLDLSRALVCSQQLPYLATDNDRATYAAAIQDWFDRHDPPDDQHADPLCRLPRTKISRAARYQRLKLPQLSDQETFAKAFKKRRVSVRVDEETGMAGLHARVAVHDALTADYRLTLLAKHRAQQPGEERTLEQLRVDTLLDLIHGRVTAPATTADLEHHDPEGRICNDCETAGASAADEKSERQPEAQRHCPRHPLILVNDTGGPIGGYARPVVNLTMPFTTAAGLDDQPGQLSGGIAIPADLARTIAQDPSSTWYRMLVDPAGEFLELRTESYEPTAPIKITTDARDQTCIYPSCARPAVVCVFDHRIPFPLGPTSIGNGQPLCARHHQVKHASGYHVVRNTDGSYTWTTRYGTVITTPVPEQPVPEWSTAPGGSDMPQVLVDATFSALTTPLEEEFAALVTRHRHGPAESA